MISKPCCKHTINFAFLREVRTRQNALRLEMFLLIQVENTVVPLFVDYHTLLAHLWTPDLTSLAPSLISDSNFSTQSQVTPLF